MEAELSQAVEPEEGKMKNENVELVKDLLLGAVDPEMVIGSSTRQPPMCR